MEQRGVLKSWNDQKGFGFIQPEQGGEQLFVHISAMRGDRRPTPGEQVLFIAERDQHGRARAKHMRFNELSLDRPAIRRKPRQAEPPAEARTARRRDASAGVQNLLPKLLMFAVLCALPLGGALQMLRSGFVWLLCGYALFSLVSFLQYWADKNSAQKRGWRTPENTLHAIELLGGWPGALLAQQAFRHKTRKVSYQVVFWGIVVLHQAFWIDWLLLGGKFSRQVLPQLAGLL